MRRNVVSVGNTPIRGDVGKIYAAGEVNIIDADALKLNGAGNINITNSTVAETKIGGTVTIDGSNFGTIRMAGDVKCNGLCKADTMIMVGKLEAEQLECKILRNFSEKSIQVHNDSNRKETSFRFNSHWDFNINSSVGSRKGEWDINWDMDKSGNDMKCDKRYLNPTGGSIFKGGMKAETFENLCDFNLNFDYKFKNILSIDPLRADGVLECEELFSFGTLDMEGVNADTVYIHPRAESKVRQVMGSDIAITDVFTMDQIFDAIPKSADISLYKKAAAQPAGLMQIDSIEGDTIRLDYVQAKTVSGDNITIGDYCIIDRVEYISNIQVSPKASVKEMVQL